MLNDRLRNQAYDNAIRKAVHTLRSINPLAHIDCLDIGAGTGILSMFAARAEADHVYAAEMSRVFCQVAQECITRNGFEKSITVLHANSNDLTVPQSIPTPVSLIFTELVDSGLLGPIQMNRLTVVASNANLKPCPIKS